VVLKAKKAKADDSDEEEDDDCCTCCSKKWQDRCFVAAVVVQIAFGVGSYWYLLVLPWRWWNSSWGLLDMAMLHSTFILMSICYYKAMHTSPGFVVKGWVPPELPSDQVQKVKEALHNRAPTVDDIMDFYEYRWCAHCSQFKPPRAHHCRDLNICVLRMDHYCPWVYNAVGLRNHKYFVLFLLYASLGLITFLVSAFYRVYWELRYRLPLVPRGTLPITVPEIVLFVLNFAVTLPVTIGIISLLVYQVGLITGNRTSIEEWNEKKYRRVAKRRGMKDFHWFYDFGWRYNLRQVLGESAYEWVRPSSPRHLHTSDGTVFRTHIYDLPKAEPAPGATAIPIGDAQQRRQGPPVQADKSY